MVSRILRKHEQGSKKFDPVVVDKKIFLTGNYDSLNLPNGQESFGQVIIL